MARHFQRIEDWEEWVPPVDKERELFANGEESIVMEIHHLSKEQKDRYQRLEDKFKRQGMTVTTSDRKAVSQIFEDNVRNVQGYSVDGNPIETGEDLYARGDDDVILEVVKALYGRAALDGGLTKKLRSGLDTTYSHQIVSAPGDARGVTTASAPITLEEPARKIPSCA